MSYFTLAWLREGMVVLRTVSDPHGKVLVKAGTPLTAQDLAILQAAGVKGVDVQVPAEARNSAAPSHINQSESPEQTELRLEQRFRHLDKEHPLVKELQRLYRLREILHAVEHTRHDS